MSSHIHRRGVPALASGLALAALLGGCASAGRLPPDSIIETARHGTIAPSAEYPLPGGGTRLEFAHGGRATYMLDFDAGGKLLTQQQVLTEANFKNIVPGMPQDEVRFRLGPPTEVVGAGWVDHYRVWTYRYLPGDCVVFQVSIADADKRVTQAGIGSDLNCARGDKD